MPHSPLSPSFLPSIQLESAELLCTHWDILANSGQKFNLIQSYLFGLGFAKKHEKSEFEINRMIAN